MGWLSNIFKHGDNAEPKKAVQKTKGPVSVQYGADGKLQSIDVKQNAWASRINGNNKYFTQNAGSLLAASEILKKIANIPQLTYYQIDTPDGTLGRDINGFYTTALLKTAGLKTDFSLKKNEIVASQSLLDFGNMMMNQSTVAMLKQTGQYAKLILMMKCGQCNYESPVETEAGDFTRQCYCCGTANKNNRMAIKVFMQKGLVEL